LLSASDFIQLPYTPDLTLGGIAYACRSLAHTYDRMGGSPFDRLRRIVAGKAVELSFRRLLSTRQVPFDTLGATPFTDPDRYDVALGGRRVDIKSYLIYRKNVIRLIRQKPDTLLAASALVPASQAESENMRNQDIYLFAFINALITPHDQDVERALHAGQPSFFIHPLPDLWSRPVSWNGLGSLTMKSDARAPITIKLGGQDAQREFISEKLELPPRQPVRTRLQYHALAYLHTTTLPQAQISLRSRVIEQAHLTLPGTWGNIWVYGMEVILAGYLTCGDYRRLAQPLPPGSRVLQYPQTRTHNLTLPVSHLRPIDELLEHARAWGD
jgi:hypothetical protein